MPHNKGSVRLVFKTPIKLGIRDSTGFNISGGISDDEIKLINDKEVKEVSKELIRLSSSYQILTDFDMP